ncbi:MAG: ABC transporter substrate-binding protein [Lentisphaerae bacterium]|jgi:iron complex transport system substrate-binding protein|nr:ABC transporter substrate-binding protein [Lentisphaerota bacterium]MBT4823150.1 ABC transporter substrate-binding protein [Lentisphaerota bacterium]MBT5610462.1 ABC transporter substrate-binding protein [Lentisphaerota bacterium]MBT7061053.1 ABC transporter substrate-binding protein [Lentisphaerota bacterium]MBT7842162.1 ABC transporter substrate-binding protein [Lentisphaerota bacterium]
MKRPLFIASAALGLLIISYAGHRLNRRQATPAPVASPSPVFPERVISMAPSLTETLFALGLESRLVGVTRYCKYPDEAQSKPQIGGFLDPNYEAIAALKPDLILTFPEHGALREKLGGSGCAFLTVKHKTPEDILASIGALGQRCGAEEAGKELVADIRAALERINSLLEGAPAVRALIVVDRTLGAGKVDKAYIAGADGYFSRLVQLAGGANAYEGDVAFPCVSAEGILSMNPDVVIEVIASLEERGLTVDAVTKDWEPLGDVGAVKAKRVHVFSESFASLPGPRFHLLLEALARALHPEADWNAP